MKYRKKPIVIEAFQWTGDNKQTEDPIWIIDEIKKGNVWFRRPCLEPTTMKIKTLEGVMTAQVNDFIIKGVNGEIYPCKPDIFIKTYEEVKENV
ncbi:MAG: hypothetical protein RBT65_19250 [Methanolobus sp.]|nr:hypothetical protein [Methanolobus sp.]